MDNLSLRLQHTLQGRICLMGVGNVDYGDDGLGVYLAEELIAAGVQNVIIAGTTPEHYLQRIAEEGFDHLLVIDAADLGEEPGTVVFLNAVEIGTAFPQISTHKISLGVLAQVVEEAGTRVWLLGVQPESLEPGGDLSPTVQTSMEVIHTLLRDLRMAQQLLKQHRSRMEKVLS